MKRGCVVLAWHTLFNDFIDMDGTDILKEKTILLTLTNKCNLNCIYCYEGLKNPKVMDFETAKSIIKNEIGLDKNGVFLIEFHGGEPFLNFGLLRQICEWFWQTFPEAKTRFFVTINGTKFTEESKLWLSNNKQKITVALSLDGTPEMNLKNRGCSISDEVLLFVHNNWPIQNIKMTISEKTFGMLSQGVIYAHELGFPVSVNLAYGVDWNPNDVDIYAHELDKLVYYYSKHPEVEKCSIFSKSIIPILKPYEVTRHCQAGRKFKAYDVDGNYFPCHVFSSNTLKSDEWEKISTCDFENDNTLYEDTSCKECVIHNICPTCYGMNFIERGHPGIRDKRMCKFIFQEKIALSKLKKIEILRKKISDISEIEYLELKAIQKFENALVDKQKVSCLNTY